ncbi:uncharacterized protein LOC143218639 isoform X2 [Lasioglossum baleicum]|uniref:uncharacterized protein LOC143218639 isoform X2 n=1 Tax=Lasioglossum baleicum TaxID=434251 RepID=UPI003FCCE86E
MNREGESGMGYSSKGQPRVQSIRCNQDGTTKGTVNNIQPTRSYQGHNQQDTTNKMQPTRYNQGYNQQDTSNKVQPRVHSTRCNEGHNQQDTIGLIFSYSFCMYKVQLLTLYVQSTVTIKISNVQGNGTTNSFN